MSMANTRKPKTRKERSEKFLRDCGVMVDPGMPDIMGGNDAEIKPLEETVKRAVCTLLTARIAAGCGENDSETAGICAELIRRFGLEDELTADERRFFELAGDNAPGISCKEAEEFHWRSERSLPLIWACGFLGENDLEFPSHETNTDDIFDMLNACQSFREVMSKAKMHTPSEILDNADVCFRMYGACVASQKMKAPAIRGNLLTEVVREQLKSFCWLIGFKDLEDWDNIDL